ncbi:MAG: FecR domain-containing protein [Dysgonamonadaceae bacterium]|jgi:ferric-dicitrate binding protein FerR (iron transport regulator)|nr:FecR domain-containing protein [Dysgonamonadaceae bacterium]
MQTLLAKYFSGEINEPDKRRLFSEIEKDPALKDEFIRMQNLKGLMAVSATNTPNEWTERKLTSFYACISRQKRRRFLLSFARYAAVIAVAVLSTFFTVDYFNGDRETTVCTIEAPLGQRVFVTLNDGSTVWLNSRSKLQVPQRFDGKKRKVHLDGEAYFEVKENNKKPFIVETSRYDVRVLGTKFNVLNYSEMAVFETTLMEGAVEIVNTRKKERVTIAPNEQVCLVDNRLQKNAINSQDYSTWKNGVLTFDSEPFSKIIQKLELYYDVKFIIQNTQALNVVYTGKFNALNSAENIINIIHQTNKFNYRVSSDNKIIYIR